ncbi:MAG: TonB-dependent receptor [Cytophagales bacterium]|nr:TonB-dependent receptor [Cytophagales bacterium]
MMLKLLDKVFILSKYIIFGVLVQCVLYSIVPAYDGEAQKISLENIRISVAIENKSIREVFRQIEELTDFEFAYHKSVINSNQKLRIKQNNDDHSLADLLRTISRETNLGFKRVGQLIYVKKKEKRSKVEVLEHLLDEKTVSGKVTDENGEGLPGVNILVKGTAMGTITDINGNYTLSVPGNATTLVFSYVGYLQEEIEIGGKTVIDVSLVPDISTLAEVVVVGYGTQERKTVAGAVGQISGEVLEERPITNALNGLQGTVPGLTITRSSGQPGNEGYSLNIRGLSSVNSGNEPLVLIDGVEGDLNLLNPNDIESISVLKDASAAIYGARAAGGVLLVKTKSGGNGQPLKISYSANYSINQVSNMLDRVNLRQWVEMDWEAKTNANATPQFFNAAIGNNTLEEVLAKIDAGADPENIGGNAFLFYNDPNWNDQIFDNGHQQFHNINVSGGSESSRYNVSVGYQDTEGIFSDAHDNSRRINMRLNYGFDVSDKLKFDTRISYINQKTESPAIGAGTVLDVLNRIYIWLPVRTQSGQFATQWGFRNPRQVLEREVGKTTGISEVLRANITGSYEIIDGLTAYGQLAFDRNITTDDSFINIFPSYAYNDVQEGFGVNRNSASRRLGESDYANLTGYLDYKKIIADVHEISVTVGASHEQNDSEFFSAWRNDFTQDALFTLNLGDADEQFNNAGASDWAIRSFFGRATYIYDSRYIAEFNFRRDGTSVFSPSQRWGNFGGYSLAWRASEEKFVNDLGIFNDLKVRFSQGTTGNQNLNTGNLYDYIALINFGGAYPFGDGVQSQNASERSIVSQNRTWEDLKTTNIGLDFAILDARLSGSFDWFKKENNNMLLGVNLPAVLGGAPPAQNIGALETKGFELSLTWADKTNSGISYSITGILSDNQNTLTNLDGRDQVGLGLNSTREGYALNTYFGYEFDGIIQTQEELDAYKQLEGVPSNLEIGDARYRDLNGDGRISLVDDDGNDADIVNLGDNAPRYSYALNASVAYRGFDLSIFLQGVAQRTIFYTDQWRLPFEQPWWQPLQRFYGNTWSPENTGAKFPRLTTGSQRYWNYETSKNTEINGAYMRVKNITLGYTLPGNVLESAGIDKVRVFFSGEDLFTIDSVDGGYDAENTNGAANFYPFTKRYSFGLNVNF